MAVTDAPIVVDARHLEPTFSGTATFVQSIAAYLPDGQVSVCGPYRRPAVAAGLWARDAICLRAALHGGGTYHSLANLGTMAIATRSIATVHDLACCDIPKLLGRGVATVMRRRMVECCRRADLILTGSAFTKERLASFGRKAVQVPMYGPSFEPRAWRGDGGYLLSVGSTRRHKNLRRLVEAYLRSRVSHRLDLVVVGGGGMPVGRRVSVVNDLPEARLSELYVNASGFVAPSLYEGFGLPLLDAFLGGLPIWCADIPPFREIAGNSPVFFDPTSVEAIAAALDRQPSRPSEPTPDERRHYSWETAAGAHLSIYGLS